MMPNQEKIYFLEWKLILKNGYILDEQWKRIYSFFQS